MKFFIKIIELKLKYFMDSQSTIIAINFSSDFPFREYGNIKALKGSHFFCPKQI